MATFTGKINTPTAIDEHYIYTVTRAAGVKRSAQMPVIDPEAEVFDLDYISDGSVTSGGTDVWDLTLVFKRSAPRMITVNIRLNGGTDTTDTPTVQDGKA